ncbi:probable disease resistance RPP8-like protein 2 [Triticum aestivum]|uniref:probable disease resistance RPP8-like protein 2 n=1 Tax=Triticum aestivum TaxID=4565 RepID=UPI001D012755|nr:probable disease resistance RPP8-like protein 2 [Triticum aestivum]
MFNDLPYHLKTCLLYLSVFPEDNWINKNTLIWRWVAEGFVSNKQGIGSFEQGESYLNELINRSMILWIEPCHRVNVGRCRVHDMVLDLIRSLSILRVLVLEECEFLAGGCRLEHVGKLVHLRYLGLFGTPIDELPREIGKLMYLQSLDVRESGIEELSPSVGELNKLMCLRASKGTRMLADVGKLTSLQELRLFSVDKVPNFFKDLGKLTELMVLEIHFDKMDERAHRALVKSLCNLRRIKTLEIYCDSVDIEEWPHHGGWEDWTPAPYEIRELTLSGMVLPRRLPWMAPSCVPHLSYLLFTAQVVEQQDLRILGGLPSLRCLYISSVDNCPLYTVLASDEFQNLRYLSTNIDIKCGEGALPMLHKLVCGASIGMEDIGLVPGSMPLLEKVTYWLNCKNCNGDEVEETEAKLRHATRIHPNSPALAIRRHNYKHTSSGTYKDQQQGLPRLIIQSLKRVIRDGGEVSATDEEPDDGGARKIARIVKEEAAAAPPMLKSCCSINKV